jgi:hypothetical protein
MKNRLLIAAACAVLLAACGHKSDVTVQNAVSNGATAPAGPVVATAGTTFDGTLSTAIGSKTSKDGDTFTLAETKGPLAGSTVDGHLVGVVAAGPLRKPAMTLVFDDIRLADGTKEPISVTLVSQGVFDPKSHHLRTIGMMVGGAIAAHHIGKGHAMLGAIGGYAASQALKTDMAVPAGATISLKLNAPVTDTGASAAP